MPTPADNPCLPLLLSLVLLYSNTQLLLLQSLHLFLLLLFALLLVLTSPAGLCQY